MNVTEQQVQDIVTQVIRNLGQTGQRSGGSNFARSSVSSSVSGMRGVFDDMDAAVEAAAQAYASYRTMGMDKRKVITDAVRQVGRDHQEPLSRMVFEETQMGRYEDKLLKHTFAADMTPGIEDLKPNAWSGANGLAVEEYAPFGVIGAITPSTHPSETLINNAVMMLAAGNSVVVNAHPSAKKVSAHVVGLINDAIIKAGGPENLVTTVSEPTIDSATAMFHHKKVALLSITGGPGVVRAAMKSNKKVIAAGPGNPPVVIDETADLKLAVEKITKSASFDNNILCTAEKEVFVVDSVFNAFMQEMEKAGNKKLLTSQMDQLAQKVFEKKKFLHIVRREFVGRNASVLAKELGIHISDSVPLLFGETDKKHLFVEEEQLMPCLPIVRVRDFEEGLACALEAEHGYTHTASCFTRNMDRGTRYARELNCSIVVINGGTYQGNGGEEGEGTLSFTISTPTGEAITRPRNFARLRRVMTAGSMRFI